MARWVSLWDVDLSASVAARDGQRLAGVSLLAMRGLHGWVAGFGIAPDWRGRRLSHQLFAGQMAAARALGLADVRLEVLTRNPHARRVYAAGGFGVLREVSVLQGPLPDAGTLAPEDGQVFPIPVTEALNRLEALHTTPPAWQREPRALERQADGAGALACAPTPEDRGVVLYRRRADQVNILDIAAAGPDPGATVRLLLHDIGAGGEGPLTGRVLNEPDEPGGLVPALLAAGMIEVDRQHEMIWQSGRAAG